MAGTAAASHYLLFLLVWWLALLLGTTYGGCIEAEKKALLQFKLGLQDPQGNLSTWMSNNHDKEEDCCSGWSGVGCDRRTGHVVELNLRGMKLGVRGSNKDLDRPTLCHLKHLRHLDFSSNNFYNCNIPSFLGCFTELRYLNLSTSYFRGIVPFSLGNLSNLVRLDLSTDASSRYYRSSSKPYIKIDDDASWLRRLLSLEYIDMSYIRLNNSSSQWIQSLNELPSLSTLICNNCKMKTIFPKSLRLQFSSLQTLDLSYCRLKGHLPTFIESMQLLEELDLSGNCFTGSIPIFLGNLTSLQKLDLSNNNFNGFIPHSIGNLSLLRSLDLSWSKLNGTIPFFIEKLSSLQILDLSYNNFNGSIPTFLGNLTLLQKLDLSNNNFNGFIPPSIGNLLLLRSLDLSSNNFNRFISPSIENLSLLQKLDLSNNNFNGSILTFLGNLALLQFLDLSFNKFSGSIPKSLCNLSFLENLYLHRNDNINGADVPKCFWKLSKLKELSLGGHDFILSETHFKNMSHLTSLYLESNLSSTFHVSSSSWVPPFSLYLLSIKSWRMKPNEFPTWIHTQENLRYLKLSNVGISGSLPAWIWNLSSSLGWLNVTSNNMDGEIPDATNSNNVFRIVDLSSNKFEGSKWLSTISNMTSTLWVLSLSNNTNLFGGIPSLLCEAHELKTLDLSKNNFSGEIPDCLMKVLYILHLGSNKFNGTFPKIQEHPCTLRSLHLENNELYGSLPSSLSKCSRLVVLDLGENKLNGSIPSWTVENMQSLKIIRLRSNRLSGNIPYSISRLESLQVLDLGNNNLLGLIPKVVGDFKAMKDVHKQEYSINSPIDIYYVGMHIQTSYYNYTEKATINIKGRSDSYGGNILSLVTSIDLSNNKLSGVLPHELGDLYGLWNLNLSGNQLTGSIPKTLGGLLNLETLDLSRNNLSGQIPQEMVRMTFLAHLNLSFNNLSGSIPQGNQFATFNNGCYKGNLNLCGFPLSKNCKEEQNPKSKSKNKDDDEKEKLWLYMTAVLGFIVGFWTFYGILFFKKTWRYLYLQFLDDTSEALYMKIIQLVRRMVR